MFGVVGFVIVEAASFTATKVREIIDVHHSASTVSVLASASGFHEELVWADPLGVGDRTGLLMSYTPKVRGDFPGVTH